MRPRNLQSSDTEARIHQITGTKTAEFSSVAGGVHCVKNNALFLIIRLVCGGATPAGYSQTQTEAGGEGGV